MSQNLDELHTLVRQLRAELSWAARTGIQVAPVPVPPEEGPPPPELPPPPGWNDPPPAPAVQAEAPRPKPPVKRSADPRKPWEAYMPEPGSEPEAEAEAPAPSGPLMPPNWAGDAAQAPATHETPAPRSEAPTSAQGDAPQVHAAAPAPTSSAPRQVSGDAAPSSAPPVPVAAASTPVAASHAPTTLTAASALQEHAPSTQPAYRDDAPPPHSAPVNAPAAHLAPPADHSTPPAPTDTPDWATPSAPGTSRLPVLSAELAACATLEHVQDVLGPCTRCKLHRLGRQKIVFGVGNPHADVMFVGEGPGADEDRIGEPFVGKAGQLLTRIIENGMGLPRSAVYIANVVKCRPPQNRDPEPDEMEACEPFLLAQIRLVQPRVLVTLGRPATQTLLRNTIPITKQRGKWTHFNGIPLMPTFHPAYVLRNPAEKRPVWEDIQEVMRFLRLPIPSRRGQ